MFEIFLNDACKVIFTLDSAGEILAVNPYVEKIFGYTPEELLGQSIDVLIPVNMLTPHQDSMFTYWQAPSSVVVGSGERMVGRRKNGSRFKISAYLAPLLSSKGLQALCVVRNEERSGLNLSDAAIIMLDVMEKENRQLAERIHTDLINEMDRFYGELKYKDQKLVQADILLASIDRGRSICQEIYPSDLFSEGLDKIISNHSQKIANAHRNFSITLDLMPDGARLDQRTQLVLFRGYQQVISNILRHAHATSVQILLAFDKDRIILEIDDNGLGFELPEHWEDLAKQNQYGLIKTAAEVNAIEGRIIIATSPGEGTSVRFVLPNRTYHLERHQGRRFQNKS